MAELLLLLCLKRLVDKEVAPPHNLKMMLREYAEFLVSAKTAQVAFSRTAIVRSVACLAKSTKLLASLGQRQTGRQNH
eukprot:1623115-Pleurochrysis_carterae.AAC.3